MKTLPISAIYVAPDRQRREFDLASLNELGESIKQRGLFHPVVLRREECKSYGPGIDHPVVTAALGKSMEPAKYILVAGERRLRAISDIHELGGQFRYDNQIVPVGHIPYVELGDLTELERAEAEYDENSKRANLTWQEDAAAVQRLAEARARHTGVSQLSADIVREVARTVVPAAKDLPTGALGIHQENTRRQIIVAAHMSDPEVKAAKSVDEAFKLVRRKEDAAKRVAHAVEIGRTYSADTAHTALNEDSLTWMTAAEANQFDVICTDPIFGIGADEFGDSGGHAAGAHFYKDDYETWLKHASCLALQGFRITKAAAHLYAFCDITRFEEFKQIVRSAGWDPFRTPITWTYPNGNRTPWVDGGPQRKTGWILYARKGKKPVTRIYPDSVSYPADTNLGHHAQKPVALYLDLLRRSCNPGDSILDPFAGSGPVFPAAQELKLKATGIELDKAAYGLCLNRLNILKSTPELTGL